MSRKPPKRRVVGSPRNLRTWQEAILLAVDVHAAVERLPRHQSDLAAQMRSASTRIHLTISEGHGKSTVAEFARYLDMAHGSLHEVESGMHFARVANLVPHDRLDAISGRVRRVEQLMTGLQRYLARTLAEPPPEPDHAVPPPQHPVRRE